MSFKDLNLKFSYESIEDDPLTEFYLPVLSQAVSYDRIAGYFSSSSLAVAAKGIAGLIKNGGKMRIIASPNLSNRDSETMEEYSNEKTVFYERSFINELNNLEDEFQKDHVKALGWLLSKGRLEIKIASFRDNNCRNEKAVFHQKVGILKDEENNILSFSGSINETASGWIHNIEEFKVFCGWKDVECNYLFSDVKKFTEFWNGERDKVRILDISEAFKEKLIKYSSDLNLEEFIIKNYTSKCKNEKISLFDYQERALNLWFENECNLLLEMATGTGKTRTAIACTQKLMKTEECIICIISTPQMTLSSQWKKEIDKFNLAFDLSLIADGYTNWREEIKVALNKIKIGMYKSLVIYTTHKTSSNSDFIKLFEKKINGKILFIGDEAHGLGAAKTKKALLDVYNYRIGLSATPSRWFDDYGTDIIRNYFGNKSFEFTIKDALTTINPMTNRPFLVNYYYRPIFVALNAQELLKYQELTSRVIKLMSLESGSDEYGELLENLIYSRANIIKDCQSKYDALNALLYDLNKVLNTIIFTSHGQIDAVMKILKNHEILSHRFTQDQSSKSKKSKFELSERENIIKKFKSGIYQTLVAIKCLDEGIDIPTADTAILLASSTNPREYIQRVGRVIRQDSEKEFATIYDFIVAPDISQLNAAKLQQFEKIIFEKELIRVKEMSVNAINNAEVLNMINQRINGGKNVIQ